MSGDGRDILRGRDLASETRIRKERGNAVFANQLRGESEESREKRKNIKAEKNQRQLLVEGFFVDLEKDFQEGKINEDGIRDYLENHPTINEYEAYDQLRQAMREGRIDDEVKKITENPAPLLKGELARREISQKIWPKEPHKVEVFTRRERGNDRKATENWSKDFWYKSLVWWYARGEITPEDITNFFDNFSEEKSEAYQKFLKQLESKRVFSEKEPLEVKSKQKEGLDVEEIKEREKIGKAFAFFKDEFLDEIPTKEGRTIFEEILEEQLEEFSETLRRSIKEEDIGKRAEALNGDREAAEKELLKEAAKRFLARRELVTHGIMGYEKDKGFGLRHKSDLDGECAVKLLQRAGIGLGEIEYIPAGDLRRAKHNVDTAERDGFNIEYDWEKVFANRKELRALEDKLRDTKRELEETADGEERKKLEIEIASFLEEKNKKVEEQKATLSEPTIFSDHHGPYSDRGTSSTKIVYELLNKFGLLEFKDNEERAAYRRLVEFVTQVDNFSFPGIRDKVESREKDKIRGDLVEEETALKRDELGRDLTPEEQRQIENEVLSRLPNLTKYETSHRRMIGLAKSATFEQMLDFSKSGIAPDAFLSFSDLQRFGFGYRSKKGRIGGLFLGKKRAVEETLRVVKEELGPGGWIASTKYGNLLINTSGKLNIKEAQMAGASLGYDGVINYNTEQNIFFVALNKGKFDPKDFDELSQGKSMRKSMFFKSDDERLEVTLGELLNKIKKPGWNPGPKTELKKFLEREEKRERKEIYWSEEARLWWTRSEKGDLIILQNSDDVPKDFPSGDEAFIKNLRLAGVPLPLKKDASPEERKRYKKIKARHESIKRIFGEEKYYLAQGESLKMTEEEKEELRKEREAMRSRKEKKPEIKQEVRPPKVVPDSEKEVEEKTPRAAIVEAQERVEKAGQGKNERIKALGEEMERARQETLKAKRAVESIRGISALWRGKEKAAAIARHQRAFERYKEIQKELLKERGK